jgi:hypothetical protein
MGPTTPIQRGLGSSLQNGGTMKKGTRKGFYKKLNDKMGKIVPLPIACLVLSDMCTRSHCINKKHAEYLAGKIRERGFHPQRAISVNEITDIEGDRVRYRVVAGVHRFEAAKLAGLNVIPSLIYHNLTDEEECMVDTLDNQLDEMHLRRT